MNESSEIWKPIPNYEDYYLISSKGRVKSIRNNIIIKTSICGSGYESLTLCVNKIKKSFMTHRLVGLCFIPNPNNYPQINHKDENKLNNNVENLEWCTKSYNERYGSKRQRANLHRNNHLIALKGALKHNYKKIAQKLSIPIEQYTLDNRFVKKWNSMREAARILNYTTSEISSCCNNKTKSYKGYIWRKCYE